MNTWPTLEEARAALADGTGEGVRIAVLDSGVEAAHPDLSGLTLEDDIAIVEQGLALAATPGGGRDVFGHGTAVAGILREIAPAARLGSFRVLGEHLRSRSLIIREGARLALERGYHILNCSFGCAREDHVLLFKDWLDEAYLRGRHVVAASNNQDFTRREWPGHFPTVITVQLVPCERADALFARRGHLVEFGARGENLEVPWLNGARKRVTGSSFATPHVAGLLARLLSRCPALSPLHAKTLLLELGSAWMPPRAGD